MLLAGTIFAAAIILIAALFSLKSWELSRGRRIAPAMRERADAQALELKRLAEHSGGELQKLWPLALLLSRYLVHEAALGFAQIARMLEQQAHNVAELVSHKRTFTPRETRSEFLRKVGDRAAEPKIERDTTGEIDQL